ncbi:hypothetical protein IV102_31460 [bacterium]|nr:hypothetical protein [bacterium]
MGRKKSRTSVEVKTPGSAPGKKGANAQAGDKKVGASPKIILSMGLGGAFLGFLSGLNQWPQLPAELTSMEASAAWLGAVLGVQHLDWNSAAQGGFLGLAVGLGFASSFNFGLRKMMMTWLLAGGGLLAGALTIKTATAAAGGWILGWMLATPLRND